MKSWASTLDNNGHPLGQTNKMELVQLVKDVPKDCFKRIG